MVGSGFKDRQWQMSVLTASGSSWAILKEDSFFTIPSICPADLVTRCGMEIRPTDPSQLSARIEVLKRLRKIQREIENAMIGVSRQLSVVYETVRARNPRDWSEVTTLEIAKMINPNPSAIQIYAAHKVLLNDAVRFVATASYPFSQILAVRPREDVEDLLQVQEWVRDKNPAIDSFVTEALRVSQLQKQIANESMTEVPSAVPVEHKWSADHQTIIRFLQASLKHTRSVQANPYNVNLGYILKCLGILDSDTHIDDNVHKFLVDIGVLAPWQDLVIIDRTNRLDTDPSLLAKQEQDILLALNKSKDPNPIHPEDFYPTDPLASIRHDWGDMPVYVIDDVRAEELDDGVSVESIPSEPENTWIHIHIADPASLIPPTHLLAQNAASQHQTWYLVPRSFPLFPKAIVHHPTHGLSLGLRARNGSPENVLTFSAKLNSNGRILDFTVRAGLIRNVKVIDYDSVDAGLGIGQTIYSYPFGNAPVKPPHQNLSPEGTQELKKLFNFAHMQTRNRLDMNWFSFNRTKCIMTRTDTFPDRSTDDQTSQLYRGFPRLTYTISESETDMQNGARNTIAEMMKLAARIASMWCLERNVPMLRRCSNPMIPATEESIEFLLKARNHIGFVDEPSLLKHVIYQPPGYYSTMPGMHWGVGVPEGHGYARVTSPLRRYGDLVSHWQIHQALLQEKEGQKTTGLFDQEYMEKFAMTLGLKDQYIKGTHRRHNRYWALLFIKRWRELFADGKNRDLWPRDANGQPIEDPLHNLSGYLVTAPKVNRLTGNLQVQVQVPKLGLKELFVDDGVRDLGELGSTIPLQIDDLRLGVKPLLQFSLDKTRSVAN